MTPDLAPVSPADDRVVAAVLLRIQRDAYAVEARLIGDDRIPTLHEDLDDLRTAPLWWLAARADGEILGAIAWTETADVVDIDRLVVAPAAHRRGIGRALVTAVIEGAGTRRVIVSTGRDNRPARALYEGLGFEWLVDEEVLPCLWVTRMTRSPAK